MKKRNFLSCLLIIAIVLATISPTVLFAAEDIAQDEQVYDETYTEETEEYVEETPEAYDWTIETNELKKWPQVQLSWIWIQGHFFTAKTQKQNCIRRASPRS